MNKDLNTVFQQFDPPSGGIEILRNRMRDADERNNRKRKSIYAAGSLAIAVACSFLFFIVSQNNGTDSNEFYQLLHEKGQLDSEFFQASIVERLPEDSEPILVEHPASETQVRYLQVVE